MIESPLQLLKADSTCNRNPYARRPVQIEGQAINLAKLRRFRYSNYYWVAVHHRRRYSVPSRAKPVRLVARLIVCALPIHLSRLPQKPYVYGRLRRSTDFRMDRIPHTGRFPAFKKAIPIIAVFGNNSGKSPNSWCQFAISSTFLNDSASRPSLHTFSDCWRKSAMSIAGQVRRRDRGGSRGAR